MPVEHKLLRTLQNSYLSVSNMTIPNLQTGLRCIYLVSKSLLTRFWTRYRKMLEWLGYGPFTIFSRRTP